MKNIIIIITIICFCCLSSIIGGLLYYKKRQNDIIIYNENINDFNKKYNMNYYPPEDRIYKQVDFDAIYTAYAVIQSVESKTININDKNITLYIGTMTYPIGDFYMGKLGKIRVVTDVLNEGIHANTVYIPSPTMYITSDKTFEVLSPIITTTTIKKDDVIKVFYDPQKKVAPPFIDPTYIVNLQKI